MLEWPKDKPFKILSLDGGGIRGVFAACLLHHIESEMLPEGCLISDYFDLIAGTSTGGIIAIALGLRKPTSLIKKMYMVDGERVFPPFWTRHPWLALFRHLRTSLYDHQILEELLFEIFKEENLGRSTSRLVIPAFKGPKTEIAVLKTDHHPDFKSDWRMYAWEAARATSAAPTFLPGHAGDNYVFLDGGVWANAPVMAALVDALSAYDVTREQVQILSLGTGNAPFDVGAFAARGGLISWRKAIAAAMFLTTDNAEAQAGLLIGPDNILRLSPEGAAAAIELGDWRKATELLPDLAERAFTKRRFDIEKLFKEKVAPRHRFYSPNPLDEDAS